jgi:hypothetical protein
MDINDPIQKLKINMAAIKKNLDSIEKNLDGISDLLHNEIQRTPFELPEDNIPVLIMFLNGDICVAKLLTRHPKVDDSFERYRYWSDPWQPGRNWLWEDIIGWLPLPDKNDFIEIERK